ncbi:MAG TPA: CPBP family intramembrane glutamic endopeptidase [Armatimonadota bacterium]|jgi:hypothetical protein
METTFIFDAPAKPSNSTLLGESIVDTLVALLIGLMLNLVVAAPIVALNFRSLQEAFNPPPRYVQTFRCSSMPPTDAPLRRWAASQGGMQSVTVVRRGNLVSIEYQIAAGKAISKMAPAKALGYEVVGSRSEPKDEGLDASGFLARLASNPVTAAILIASLIASEAGFLLACAWALRRTREGGEPVPAFFRGPVGKSILFGAGMGVVALVFGEAWSLFLERVVGPYVNIDGPMAMAREFPLWGKIAIFVLGTALAPLGEEYFFRGFLFGRYAAAGRVRLGIVVSALFFAGVHLDPLNFIDLFVVGMLLAWTYHRSGSLIASMTTHAVNNAVAFGVLFASHHG